VHAANGYLIEQFLRDSINDRSDAYGGSIANRTRLLVEVMQAVAGEIGGGRTGCACLRSPRPTMRRRTATRRPCSNMR
jgi:2,4-dienoyl-CoA reductase-like NADH-dependent reductase (Old Yellow Enzyme family)